MMAQQPAPRTSPAPFRTELITYTSGLNDLFPATARNVNHDIYSPASPVSDLCFLANELSLKKLNAIHTSLWKAGRPMPARHLGHQLVLSREILLTEEMSLHLVWGVKGIYIKPLPKFLLAESFWAANLVAIITDTTDTDAPREDLSACARGLLYSYCSLIVYESDFEIAKAHKLLPCEITWIDWRKWVGEVLSNCEYNTINPRFWYGELRLGRLNKIYRYEKWHVLRGYSSVGAPSTYSEFLRDNFGLLTAVLGYVVIVLTAMQVGLATSHLGSNEAFQDLSWGFTVLSMVAPLAILVTILLVFVFMFLANWYATLRFERTRAESIGTNPRTASIVKICR